MMNTIKIILSQERLAKLRELAARFELRPEELARVGLEELLSRPEEGFHGSVEYVLRKNAELYRRLA
jgi:hypothetical protein